MYAAITLSKRVRNELRQHCLGLLPMVFVHVGIRVFSCSAEALNCNSCSGCISDKTRPRGSAGRYDSGTKAFVYTITVRMAEQQRQRRRIPHAGTADLGA